MMAHQYKAEQTEFDLTFKIIYRPKVEARKIEKMTLCFT